MGRLELEEEQNSRNLVIRRLEDKDRGLYTCQVCRGQAGHQEDGGQGQRPLRMPGM